MSTSQVNVKGMNVANVFSLGQSCTVASIFPLEQYIERRFRTTENGGYLTRYTMPACTNPKRPSVLIIGDALERQFLGTNPVSGSRDFQETPVPGGARQIAQDFIDNTRKAAVFSSENACPGIWICAGPQPIDDEIALWRKKQDNYWLALQVQADDKWFTGAKEFVGSLHRLAAKSLKLDPRQHEWMREAQTGETAPCPFCGAELPASALKCARCNEIVDVKRYHEFKKQQEKAVAQLAEAGIVIPQEYSPVKPIPGEPQIIVSPDSVDEPVSEPVATVRGPMFPPPSPKK